MAKCPIKRPFSRANQKAKAKAYRKEYELANKDKINSYRREKYAVNSNPVKDQVRKSRYKNLYGIVIEDAERMLVDQDNKCAICKIEIKFEGHEGAHVDHDHVSGIVRGILCANCNRGLGKFKDNINNLLGAINYLKKRKFILIISPFEKFAV